MDQDLIRDALLQLDDPFYLNTFQDAADEDEWFRLNETYIQQDLRQYLPSSVDTHDPATWQFIKSLLQQFQID